MPRYRFPTLKGFSNYEDEFGTAALSRDLALFATKLEGEELEQWVNKLGYEVYTFRKFSFKRKVGLDCCPNLKNAVLQGMVNVFPESAEWSCSLNLGIALKGNWMLEAIRSHLLYLLGGDVEPDPLSFEAGFRSIVDSRGLWSVVIPSHWDISPSTDGFSLMPPVEGVVGYLMGLPDYKPEEESGIKYRKDMGQLTIWKVVKRIDSEGRDREVYVELSFQADPSLLEKLKPVAEVIWGSLNLGSLWPYISLGYLSKELEALKPVPSFKPASTAPLKPTKKPVKVSSPPPKPKVGISSSPTKFDPFKPSPYLSTIGKVLASPWKRRNVRVGKPKVHKPRITVRRPKEDVSRYSWANSSTFYIDQDGSIRTSDFNDEVAADELGDDGTLYRGGVAVGRVEDGYVYDSDGNVVGRLDTSISDRWQVESYSQRVNPDTFGTDWSLEKDEVRETTSPFVSSYGRDEDDEDEDEEY